MLDWLQGVFRDKDNDNADDDMYDNEQMDELNDDDIFDNSLEDDADMYTADDDGNDDIDGSINDDIDDINDDITVDDSDMDFDAADDDDTDDDINDGIDDGIDDDTDGNDNDDSDDSNDISSNTNDEENNSNDNDDGDDDDDNDDDDSDDDDNHDNDDDDDNDDMNNSDDDNDDDDNDDDDDDDNNDDGDDDNDTATTEVLAAGDGLREFDNFGEAEIDESMIVGNPQVAVESWHLQDTASTCAVASQEFVLEALTGQSFTEGMLADYAQARGWYTPGPNGGTSPYDVGNILMDAGMRVTRGYDNTVNDLREALEKGDGVIVGVNSDRLWYNDDAITFSPDMQADHAVQVIGIDYSRGEPTFIINDPGNPDGCGAMVDSDVFMDAWGAGDNYMVSATHNA